MSLNEEVVYSNYMRQMDVINPRDILPITLIGCGASGSAIGSIYAKMGGQLLYLYDQDSIELHNIPNQWFGTEYIGRNKAESLRDIILKMVPTEIQPNVFAYPKFWLEGDLTSGIVIMCVDSIEGRKEIFESLLKTKEIKYLIDTRMASQFYEIYTIDMENEKNMEGYRSSLDLEIEEAPCTDRSVIYTPHIMGARVVYFIKRLSRGEPVPSHYMEDLSNILFGVIKDWRQGEEPMPREFGRN